MKVSTKLAGVLLAFLACGTLSAQEVNGEDATVAAATETAVEEKADDFLDSDRYNAVWNKRRKYMNIGFVKQTLNASGCEGYKWNSDIAVQFSSGRTWYLHKKPLANMIKFGIDATFVNIFYAKYGTAPAMEGFDNGGGMFGDLGGMYEDMTGDDIDLGDHQIDVGMSVGPSVTINPVQHLKVSAYFRYSPTYSMLLMQEQFGGSYVSYFNYGLSVAWRVISVGVEGRFGTGKYNQPALLEISDINDKTKLKTSGVSFYVGFRF